MILDHNGRPLQSNITEAFDPYSYDGMMDTRHPYLWDDGQQWLPIGAGRNDEREKAGFDTELELAEARRICRYIARKSAYAINGHENRISYTVGTGHTYTVVAKKGRYASPELITAAQKAIDDFIFENQWHNRQAELRRREDRDGEAFLRFFKGDDCLIVRFVEPAQVTTPTTKGTDPSCRMGIRTEPDDVETVLGYFIDGEEVKATDIQHRKANVDRNVRRGSPLFWPVVETLNRVKKVNRNMAAGSDIQTAIGALKRVTGSNRASADALKSASTDLRANSPIVAGRTDSYQFQRPGKVLTVSDNVDYEFPFSGVRYSQYVEVIQCNLREVASLLVMPEFMLTSDASNANFASTMVAEGPAVKNFERLQKATIDHDLAVMWRAVEIALGDEAAELLNSEEDELADVLEIQVEPPTIKSRDELQEATRDQLLKKEGILSPQTFSARHGLDYDQEQANFAAYGKANPPPPVPDQPAQLAAVRAAIEGAETLEEVRAIISSLVEVYP